MQLEKNRLEQIEKYYPNLICTQSLGHVRNFFLVPSSVWCSTSFNRVCYIFIYYFEILTYSFLLSLNVQESEFQMAITSERLHKQSVIIKQICKLFPQRRVLIQIIIFANLLSHYLHLNWFALIQQCWHFIHWFLY